VLSGDFRGVAACIVDSLVAKRSCVSNVVDNVSVTLVALLVAWGTSTPNRDKRARTWRNRNARFVVSGIGKQAGL
jgi:hypothetical protein